LQPGAGDLVVQAAAGQEFDLDGVEIQRLQRID
jgi:hypothetical protein